MLVMQYKSGGGSAPAAWQPVSVSNLLYNETLSELTVEFINDVKFSSDGTRMYFAQADGDENTMAQYTLTTPWDVRTRTGRQEFNHNGLRKHGWGIEFKPDGTAVFLLDNDDDVIEKFTLGTPWDLSTYSLSQSYSLTANSQTRGLAFSPDGTKMFTVNNAGDAIIQHNLSVGWDLTTASAGTTQSTAGFNTIPTGININPAGTIIYLTNDSTNSVQEIPLSTPFDLSTAQIGSITTTVIGQGVQGPRCITFKTSTGDVMYIIDALAPYKILAFQL